MLLPKNWYEGLRHGIQQALLRALVCAAYQRLDEAEG